MRREEDGLQIRASTCTLAPDLSNTRIMHKHHNNDHTLPFFCESGDKTQGAETITAGDLIMASSLVVLYIDSALGEMC